MPVNGEHYFGLNFARIGEFIEMLRSEPARIERVAAAGRTWANEHYSPKAMAERFLCQMDLIQTRNEPPVSGFPQNADL